MNIRDKYRQFIKGEMTEKDMDSFTTDILKDYYKDQERKKRWSDMVDERYDLSHLKGQVGSETASKSKSRLLYLALTAAASVLLLVGLFRFFGEPSTITASQMAQEFLTEPYPYTESRKGPKEDDERRTTAGNLYSKADYKNAILVYDALLAENAGTTEDFIYLGLSHLYNQEAAQAIPLFEKVIADPKTEYAKDAKWYLALAYIQNDKKEKAKLLLQKIETWGDKPDSRNWDKKYARQASMLLESLN